MKKKAKGVKVRQYLTAQSREELIDLVCSLAERFPDIQEEFVERMALSEGAVGQLVALARKELDQITSEPGWTNEWSNDGYIPDYSRLTHRLERLVEQGHHDAVAQLGREIVEQGIEHAQESHDDGETGIELAKCLTVVFKAVAKSNWTPSKKLLFAIDALHQDGYGILDDVAGIVLDQKIAAADWSVVAETLTARLKQFAASPREGSDRNYERDHISHWLGEALKNAGREGSVVELYEREARATNSYERLVRYLIGEGRYDDAERWAREGIERTAKKLPGIASALTRALRDIAQKQKRWDLVAAHEAWTFVTQPNRGTFQDLVKAADKAKCRDAVHDAALRFLETGISPIPLASTSPRGNGAVTAATAWPLPTPDYFLPLAESPRLNQASPGPHYGVLIDMAIAAKRPDEVLRWYDAMDADKHRSHGGNSWYDHPSYGEQVAAAVAKSHPDRALELYRTAMKRYLPRAEISAYEAIGAYLRKMRPILDANGRAGEWTQLLEELRLQYRNRPRFMEILDKCDGRPNGRR